MGLSGPRAIKCGLGPAPLISRSSGQRESLRRDAGSSLYWSGHSALRSHLSIGGADVQSAYLFEIDRGDKNTP
jgi:hypothetical protein